jgi:hypothetical protein
LAKVVKKVVKKLLKISSSLGKTKKSESSGEEEELNRSVTSCDGAKERQRHD